MVREVKEFMGKEGSKTMENYGRESRESEGKLRKGEGKGKGCEN